jgi:secreted trypsin-like serine protease
MFFKIIFISLISSVLSNPQIAPLISGGSNAEISEFPFLVSSCFKNIYQLRKLIYFYANNFKVSIQQLTLNICNGILLSESFVISAGNCLQGRSISALTLEYGNTVITPDNSVLHPNQVRIQRIIYHPEFNDTERINDLCLIEPVSEIRPNFANPYASLSVPGSRYSSGTHAVHAGNFQLQT